MSDKPQDPASEAVDQGQRESNSYAGQEGYGVKYEEGQYREGSMQPTPEQGRSGSYETNNQGGYGTGQPDAEGNKATTESPASPPDPEAGVGQGGQ